MSKPWAKMFKERSTKWLSLPWHEQQLFAVLHTLEVADDGTVAQMCPGETPGAAVLRVLGVPPRSRRFALPAVGGLLRAGFLLIDGDLVKLANWSARQKWRKGPIPLPFIEQYDPETGEVYSAPSGQNEAPGDQSTTSQRPVNDQSMTSQQPVNDQSMTSQQEPTMRNDSAQSGKNGSAPSNSNSASKSKSPPAVDTKVARGGARAGATDTPAGQDPSGSDGAPVVDPADFSDAPLEERERQYAAIPQGGPTPDEADEATEIFDGKGAP